MKSISIEKAGMSSKQGGVKMFGKKVFFKAVSVIVTILFVVNNISYAAPDITQGIEKESTLRVLAAGVDAGTTEALGKTLQTSRLTLHQDEIKMKFSGEKTSSAGVSSLGVPAIGRLLDPGRFIEQEKLGDAADKFRAVPKPKSGLRKIHSFLDKAGNITLETSLRGADIGSSMDLGRGAGMGPGLKELVTKRGEKMLADIAQTIIIPSKFKAKIKVSNLSEAEKEKYGKGSIVYISKLHGCPENNPGVYKKKIKLDKDGKAPRQQTDMVGYILWNLFGVHGVKVEFDVYHPDHPEDETYGIVATKGGGMGTSGATNTLLFELGQMLTDAGLTLADCAAEAIDIENTTAGGYTGGQEGYTATAADIADGANAVNLVWISGVRDKGGNELYQPHAAFSVPMLTSPEDIEFVEEHTVFLQVGANFGINEKGKLDKLSHRSAACINTGWMHSAETTRDEKGNDIPNDPVGAEFHQGKPALTADMRQGLLENDVTLINKGNQGYVKARNGLSLREAQLIVEGDKKLGMPPQAQRLDDYAISDKIGLATYGLDDTTRIAVEKLLMPILEKEKREETITKEDTAFLNKYAIENLKYLYENNISLYSDYSKDLYEAMDLEMQENPEISMSAFNTGAGGDGGIIMLWSSGGKKHIANFLERRLGIKRFDPETVVNITTVTGGRLSGWMDFEVGEIGTRITIENMTLTEAAEEGFKVPEASPMMTYSEVTGEYVKASSAGVSSLGVEALGRLLDPGYFIEKGMKGDVADKYRAVPNPTVKIGRILTFLEEAGSITLEASLRGADLGSSMDLGRGAGMRPGLKELVTKRGENTLADIAQTIVIPSDFRAKIRISALSEDEKAKYGSKSIVYISELHGCTAQKPGVYKSKIKLIDGKAPRQQADMVGYILWNLFGVNGVKVEFNVYSPEHPDDDSYGIVATKGGGMGTSGATNTLLYEAGQMLSQAGLSLADCAAEAIDAENTIAGGYTGGQEGYVATAADVNDGAKAVNLVWISGIRDADGNEQFQPHAAYSIPMLQNPEDVQFVEEHAAYLQVGANFAKNDKGEVVKISHRSAACINTGWMHSAETIKDENGNDIPIDPVGAALHQSKPALVAKMREGLLKHDVRLINEGNDGYVKARDGLSLREAELIVQGDVSLGMPPQTQRLDDYAISDKIGLATYGLDEPTRIAVEALLMPILEKEKKEETITEDDTALLNEYAIKNLKYLYENKISLYSDYSKDLYDAMALEMQENPEISMSAFNTGAGGDGGIIMLWSSGGQKHIEDFLLRRLGIRRFDPETVVNITTVTGGRLSGWMPFKVGDVGTKIEIENMTLDQAAEQGFRVPEASPMMTYDEATGEYAKASSAGTYKEQITLTKELLEYAPNLPEIAAPLKKQAVVVYSDALLSSEALQDQVSLWHKGATRRYYLVNKEGIELDELFKKLEAKGITRDNFDLIFENQESENIVALITSAIQKAEITQLRVFALSKEDVAAWSRQQLVDALILVLDTKEFVIITPDDKRRELYEKSLSTKQALIAA
ncbi:MAG: hypothetical protein ABH843_03465 [Candidatus Omnitrophota bacterium]